MADLMSVEAVNVDTLAQAMADAPALTYRNVDQETHRFGNRFRTSFIKLHMSGPPGLQWGGKSGIRARATSIGKNVRAFGTGGSLDDYRFVTKISSFLATHERGDTIQTSVVRLQPGLPYNPGKVIGLFKLPGFPVLGISKEGHFKALYLLRKSVTEKPRLGFVDWAKVEIEHDLIPHLEDAMVRAMQQAMEDRVRSISDVVQQVVHAY